MAMSLWPHFFGPCRAAGNAGSATLSDDAVITQLLSLSQQQVMNWASLLVHWIISRPHRMPRV